MAIVAEAHTVEIEDTPRLVAINKVVAAAADHRIKPATQKHRTLDFSFCRGHAPILFA